MKVYIVMIEDRHADTEARPFSTPEKAVAFAERLFNERSDGSEVPDDEATMSEEDLQDAGWLFYGCYSVEGDCIWVEEAEVDQE